MLSYYPENMSLCVHVYMRVSIRVLMVCVPLGLCMHLGNESVWMFVSVHWHAVPRVSRCVHVYSRARRLLNICFAGPWGVHLAELPALHAVFLTARARPPRSVNFLRVNS